MNFLHFFGRVRFALAELASSPPFPLLGNTSPLAHITMLPRRVVFPSHGAKTSSLPPLHLLVVLCSVTSPREPKSKH
jgi:hypothetical protein